jgi:hypothetical protein
MPKKIMDNMHVAISTASAFGFTWSRQDCPKRPAVAICRPSTKTARYCMSGLGSDSTFI